MYFRCLATDILVVARRTQRFQGRFASNRLWNLVRRWFPAAFPWAGAAEPTGSVQSRIGKPQSLGVRLRRGPKTMARCAPSALRAARTCDGKPSISYRTASASQERTSLLIAKPTTARGVAGILVRQGRSDSVLLADPIIVGRTVA